MTNKAETAIAKLEQTSSRKMALRIWLRVLTSSQLIEKRVRGRFRAEFDTTLPRFDVMAALARVPQGQTMGDISRWLLVSSGNITGIISRLEADGLVTRTRDAHDHRTYTVKLSRTGRQAFERLSRAHEKWVRNMLAGMSRTEMVALDGLLKKLKVSLAQEESS